GWRGWLLPNLRSLGTWPALLLSGVIWGVWHAPLILLGYNFGYTDLRGVGLMIVFCVFVGILLGWLRLRTATVWPCVLGHAAINSASSVSLMLLSASELKDVQALGMGSFLGIPGWILMAVVIVVLVLTRQLRKQVRAGAPTRAGVSGQRHLLPLSTDTAVGALSWQGLRLAGPPRPGVVGALMLADPQSG